MSDNRKFHEFAFQSILFKGRPDWYFCYLKMEKISQVLLFLSQRGGGEMVLKTAYQSGTLSGEIAHLAAGEIDARIVLADLFSLMSSVRLHGAAGVLSLEATAVLVAELEQVAERLVHGSHPSPFVSADDFSVPALAEPLMTAHPMRLEGDKGPKSAADSKGQNKGHSKRMSLILSLIQEKKSVSIKEIGAVIKDCSEKTIQRELNILIERGLIRREGERRWSVYRPI